MFKLAYTYKDYVGVKTKHIVIFKTERKYLDFIKSHPTIKILSTEKTLDKPVKNCII